MGKMFQAITESQAEFISDQKLFFVGTAAEEGSVSVSPKGMDSLRVLDAETIAWLNLTGSGNETSAHVQMNPRMTLMFCAFEGKPLILRVYGHAKVVHQNDPEWQDLLPLFPNMPGARQVFILTVERTQESCGTSIPFYDYKENRNTLVQTMDRMGKESIENFWKTKNTESIDGFPTNIRQLSGLNSE